MTRQSKIFTLIGMVGLTIALGCTPQMPFYLGSPKPVPNTSVAMATKIDYPDAEVASLNEVDQAQAPYSLTNSNPRELWDLSLEDAIRYALENSRVMRNLGGVSFGANGANGVPSSLLSNPASAMTVWNPAITETDPRYGVEGVLSDFDAQWVTNTYWGKSSNPSTSASQYSGNVMNSDTGSFQTYIQKTAATGTTFTVGHNFTYTNSNSNYAMTPSYWQTNLKAEFTHPWLQGGGVQFNRIAGKGAVPGYYNGVMIARIRTDTSLCDFETSVEGMVFDTERAYWELYYAYRLLDTVLAGRNSALQTWRQVYAKYIVGHTGGSAQEEAQSRQQYFQFRSSVEQALSNLYGTESKLRYIMGLASTDGRLIRPSTEPTTARIVAEWDTWHCEALTRNISLRKQKWVIKQRQLELIASKNFLLPELNTFGSYQWNGLGKDLLDDNTEWLGSTTNAYRNSAWGSMTNDGHGEWQLGLYLSVPIGFRSGRTAVRNAELNLLREKAILQEQELELTHQLSQGVRDLEDYYTLAQTNYNRRAAAQREVEATTAAYEQGTATLNLVLDAQRRMAEAESDYFRSVTDYNEAIITLQKYKSSLLAYNGITLCEGPWPQKAQFDAAKRAEMRRRGKFINYGYTRPRVISKGSYNQREISPLRSDDTVVTEEGTENQNNEAQTSSLLNQPTTTVSNEVLPTPNGLNQDVQPANAGLNDNTINTKPYIVKKSETNTTGTQSSMALLNGFGSSSFNPIQPASFETAGNESEKVVPAAPGNTQWVSPIAQ